MNLSVDAYFDNVIKILKHIVDKEQAALLTDEVKRIRAHVDKDAWETSPAVVNAFYTKSQNVISKLAFD